VIGAGPNLVPEEDVPFLEKIVRYFGLKGVRVREHGGAKYDIATDANPEMPTVWVGAKWQRRRRRSKIDGRLAFVHELTHSHGLGHDAYARSVGYFSKDRQRDTLPQRIYMDIERGGTRFDPVKFGLDPARLERR
jgi:hypothetical protein